MVTLDIDWAPDFAIDFVAEKLAERQVCATWFVTHVSPAIERLRQYPKLFELGIHPNFLPGSTHGDTVEEVLNCCIAMVPEASSVRTHSLVQSSPLLAQIMIQTSIKTDVSLFLPHTPCLRPIEYQSSGRTLLRIPYYWQDDYETERTVPCWHLPPILAVGEGLKVFNFHPIHVYLNSADVKPYQVLKQRVVNLSKANSVEVAAYAQSGAGTQTMFMELVEYIGIGGQSLCIRDIYKRWRKK